MRTRQRHSSFVIPILFELIRKKALERNLLGVVRATYHTQKNFFPDENTGKFWDDLFSQNNFVFPMERWRIKKIVQLLDPKKSILNLGVGSGKLEQELLKRYPEQTLQYLGTDIAKKTVSQLKKRFPQLSFEVKGLTDLSPHKHQFDQILLLEVLEHIKPSETFRNLLHINSLLQKNGTFIVSVPVNEGLELMLPFNPNSHMRLYSERLLRFELEEAGFSVQQIFSASAFTSFFTIKHHLNKVFKLRQSNNLICVCEKHE